MLRDEAGGGYRPAALRRRNGDDSPVRVSRSLIRHVVQTRSAILTADVASDTRFDPSESLSGLRERSIICCPLVRGDEVIGLIQLDVPSAKGGFAQHDLELLAGLSGHLATAVENSQRHDAAIKSQRTELEERFRGLVEGSIQGILVHRRFQPLFVNEAYARLHGYTVAEILEMPTILPLIGPDEHERMLGFAEAGERGRGLPARYETSGYRRDGSTIWLEKFVSVVDWVDGPAFQTAVIDVSDRKRAEDALRAANDELETCVVRRTSELERSNRDLELFAHSVSHDLQSPLRTIANYCQLLEKHAAAKLDAEEREFLDFAVDGAHRMKRLLDDLLAYSRVSTKAKEIHPVDANDVLREAIGNLQAAIQEHQATIEFDLLPTVVADATQLMQLFQNLLGNAIRYRRDEPPTIHVAAHEEAELWRFAVRDNGVGIEARHFERIFQIFQRLYAEHEIPGSGVGLSICKRIVERHGGQIWVESVPGQGSTFFFTLPKSP